MHHPFRKFFIAAGVAGILVLLGLIIGSIWLDSFVHSDAFRHEAESRVSQSLGGGAVEIKQIDVSIWSGLKLDGLATKLDSSQLNKQGTMVARVESIRCTYSLLHLLGGRLQVKSVTILKPELVLTQLPPSEVSLPTPPPAPVPEGSTPEKARSGKTAPFEFLVESAKIVDGDLAIQDAGGITKADLKGVQLSAGKGGFFHRQDVDGTLHIATIALTQNLDLTDFSTPFTFHSGAFQASSIEADAFSGRLTGNYKIDPSGPSLLEVDGSGIDMLKVGQAANPGASTKLSGALAFQSQWHGVETGKLAGQGDAQILNGQLRGVSLLHDLAFALHVRGLDEPELSRVTTHFEVANGSTRFTNLHIESSDFEMTGNGIINAQGGLDANMSLILHGAAMGGIPGAAASFFSKLPGGGGSIPFHLGGTVANPRTDLSTGIFIEGSKVQKTISNTLSRLFQ